MNARLLLAAILAHPAAAAQPSLPGWGPSAGPASTSVVPAASAPVAWSGLELVYSYPVETALEESDLRQAQFVWPEMIGQARKSIDIEQFYVARATGQPLEHTLDALKKAGERGVRIRVLLEKKFERNSLDGIAFLKTIPNLELRIIDWSKVAGTGIVHAKFMVVDATQAYIGSQNWDWRSLKHIHELGLRVAAPDVVKGAQDIFEHDWAAAAGAAPAAAPGPVPDRSRRVYLVASPGRLNPAGVGDSEAELPALLAEAAKTLDVQVMDYNPTTYDRPKRFYPVFDNALRDAAVRGVKVRLAVANWSTDEPAVHHLKSLSLLPGIEIRVCTVPEASGGFIPFARVLHSKFASLDGGKALWLGTSNWGGGYLDHSRNLELVVRDAEVAGRAQGVFERVWNSPYCEPLDLARGYPKPRKG